MPCSVIDLHYRQVSNIRRTLIGNLIVDHSDVVEASLVGALRQVSNIRRTLIGNLIVDHSDVVEASPVGAAPTTSSFST